MARAEVVDVLRRLEGTARAQELVGLCGRDAVRRALASGSIIRVAHGRYAVAGCPDPWVSAHRLGGVISHVSAAELWEFDVLVRPRRVHVTVGRHRHAGSSTGVVLHWADLTPAELEVTRRLTSPLRTVIDCARALPFAEALCIADSALRTGLVNPRQLELRAEALRGAGRAKVLRVARAADARAASPLESAQRAILLQAGIVSFVPQLTIADDGFFARVDLGDERRLIAIEDDSFEHHGHRDALARDCRRYDELTIRGWLVLRFAWEHVMFESEWVTSMVREAVRQRPLRGQKSRK